MRLLIGSRSRSKLFHWEEFGSVLSSLGVDCRVVNNTDVADGFPTKKVYRWGGSANCFNRLVGDFNPDVILTDGLRHFGMLAIKSGIPLILYLAGDYWTEVRSARETQYSSFPRSRVIDRLERMGDKILRDSRIVMTPSAYLEGIVRKRLPGKPTYVLHRVMDPSVWHPVEGTRLMHPCVGLVQQATIWDKAKEMLVLRYVLEKLPHVTFYWAGNGPHEGKILHELGRYRNFKWLGSLGYPDGVRQFLSEVDVYTLLTGLDMAPVSLREALLMGKPTVATNVGGVPEMLEDGKSGLLVDAGDPESIIEKISYLLANPKIASQMGKCGREITSRNTEREKITKEFVRYVRTKLSLQ